MFRFVRQISHAAVRSQCRAGVLHVLSSDYDAYRLGGIQQKEYQIEDCRFKIHQKIGVIVLISLFLIVSDNVYMLALRDPDSLIAVVRTIRRGGAVIGFANGLLFLKDPDSVRKLCCMGGILAGRVCLAMGSM